MSAPADDSPSGESTGREALVTKEGPLPTEVPQEEVPTVENTQGDSVSDEKKLPAKDDDEGEDEVTGEVEGEAGVEQPEVESSSVEEGQDSVGSIFWLSPVESPVEVLTPEPSPAPELDVTAAAGPSTDQTSTPAYYMVKWITWKEKKTPIVTQSQNGPCPLLAIMNTLFLRWKASLPAETEVVSSEDLMTHLGECVLSVTPREKSDGMDLNFQQNISDVMAVLPKLSTGLDVNVRFTGVADFEYTPECIVFDLLSIPLYHGWLVDPQNPEMVASVGTLSYNQLVEKIIHCKHSEDSSLVSEGLVAEQFLESTATQLSYHGLCELNSTANDEEISVFFRNNHFSTMIKHKGHLYLLVTDQGFLEQEQLVWESLHNLEGDGNFCDCNFRLCHPPQRLSPLSPDPTLRQQQIQQDYLVAMSLQKQQEQAPGNFTDLDLARQLQQEEYLQQQQQPPPPQQQQQQSSSQQARPPASHPRGARTRDKDSDCTLL
ncbi:ubiquitin carboxyl-terminal hydrolase MINDY-1 isoform X1 [Synchiropus splendidus]|uniref:ubiquitin carboxyl-terminal hydrolase MINDY-1 isoform X1 n=1 Tax=Synchiropus splendidus TaxID=270530 RepID=UPI00237DD486|nr:ubiquitin carboxyl-terminal hydrolase MINDY-1 isoform X1 [Synchiropus splendidus]XP_053717671.1 ubiquitin carboxyl-terminal hydrolase MINDY-1 isoform X1 [Synchiropus splendidus]XP_053717672.1 ubiquitin carboxyl-terminal hydrolase MINDY-1 isoform X1 [Synchiropus splendidus]